MLVRATRKQQLVCDKQKTKWRIRVFAMLSVDKMLSLLTGENTIHKWVRHWQNRLLYGNDSKPNPLHEIVSYVWWFPIRPLNEKCFLSWPRLEAALEGKRIQPISYKYCTVIRLLCIGSYKTLPAHFIDMATSTVGINLLKPYIFPVFIKTSGCITTCAPDMPYNKYSCCKYYRWN